MEERTPRRICIPCLFFSVFLSVHPKKISGKNTYFIINFLTPSEPRGYPTEAKTLSVSLLHSAIADTEVWNLFAIEKRLSELSG